jgi:hypothetical protein
MITININKTYYKVLVAARKNMKHNKNVTPTVTNNTGVNCEKTLNP